MIVKIKIIIIFFIMEVGNKERLVFHKRPTNTRKDAEYH